MIFVNGVAQGELPHLPNTEDPDKRHGETRERGEKQGDVMIQRVRGQVLDLCKRFPVYA